MNLVQMGSSMKRTIFDEQTSKALKKWHKTVKKKQQQQQQQKGSSHASSETPTTDTTEAGRLSQCQFVAEAAPVAHRHLHRYKTIAHVGATRAPSDSDCSDTDAEAQTRYLIPPTKQRSLDSEVRVDLDAATPDHHDSFSFQRLPPAQNAMEK